VGINGTLALVPLGGGGPRELQEGVTFAGFAPDGELAIVHLVDEKRRIEWPIGKTLYETDGLITEMRVSPDGRRLAFFDSPHSWSEGGFVAVLEKDGKKRRLTGEWSLLDSLAWTPRGDEIWFTGIREGVPRGELHAVSLSGRERAVTRNL